MTLKLEIYVGSKVRAAFVPPRPLTACCGAHIIIGCALYTDAERAKQRLQGFLAKTFKIPAYGYCAACSTEVSVVTAYHTSWDAIDDAEKPEDAWRALGRIEIGCL